MYKLKLRNLHCFSMADVFEQPFMKTKGPRESLFKTTQVCSSCIKARHFSCQADVMSTSQVIANERFGIVTYHTTLFAPSQQYADGVLSGEALVQTLAGPKPVASRKISGVRTLALSH